MFWNIKYIDILLINVYFAGMGRIPVTGMLAGMNLSNAGMNL